MMPLTETQARRCRMRIAGMTLDEIAEAEGGVSRIAVFKSIIAAHRKLTGEDIGSLPDGEAIERLGGAP